MSDWHEEPTQHRAGSDAPGVQEPWYEREYGARFPDAQERPQQTPPGAWSGASSPQVPVTQTRPAVTPPRWLVPFVAVMCLVTGFALVTLLLQRTHASKASPTPSQVTQTSTATPAPSSSTTPSSSSPVRSATTTVTSTTTPGATSAPQGASFPDSTSPHCLLPTGGEGTVSDPDVRQARSTNSSCSFLPNVKDAVWTHATSNPDEPSYSLGVFSQYRKDHITGSDGTVDLRCKAQGALVKCVSDDPEVEIWVRQRAH